MSAATGAVVGRARPVAVGGSEIFLQRVLSDAEASAATREVLDPTPFLREQCWHVGQDPITIGAPLYRNRERLEVYAERARATNRLLYETYRWLFDRVADVLEDRYRSPVDFVEELAVPGFHLMAYAGPGRYEGGGWHFDQMAQQVPYFADRAAEVHGVLNFTLPLAVPSGGTGMDVVDDVTAEGGRRVQVHVPYQPGVMVLSERELLHRIGASVCREAGEWRLTLQGHAVHFRGHWLLFW